MSSEDKTLTDRLKTRQGMLLAAIGSITTITITIGLLLYLEIRKNKNAKKPLGFRNIDKSKIKPITDRQGKDIVKDRFNPSKTRVPKNIDYIVIGSGIGGLSCAAYLSRVGRRVLVLEQHDRLGGCLHQFGGKFQWDTGVHYVGKPNKLSYQLAPITSEKKPVQFVALGNKKNGYVYDEYLLGNGDDTCIVKARALTRKEDLKTQFKDAESHAMIEKWYKLSKTSNFLNILIFGSKIIENSLISKIFMKIAKWKFPQLWNKTVTEVSNHILGKNPLLRMAILANFGDFGGHMKTNPMTMLFALNDHYRKGGFFINGGPQEITRSIMPVIESNGGRCLANAPVKSIIFENDRAVGVIVDKGNGKTFEFRSKYGVISTAGFRNTYTHLAPLNTLPKCVSDKTKMNIQRLMNEVEPSAQHIHIFIGFNKTAEELGFPAYNRWYMNFDDNGKYDYDQLISEFHKDPLNAPMMGFLSFPSAKNPDYENERPGKANAIVISEVPRYHFEKWKDFKHEHRGQDYEDFKEKIARRLMDELLFKFYPKSKDAIVKYEVGTALSAEYYLGSMFGESYGLHHSCNRYFDYELNQLLKPKQCVKGLYLSGQDILCCGVGSALQSGIWTAESILGYHKPTVMMSGRNLVKDLNNMDGNKKGHLPIDDFSFDRLRRMAAK